MKRKVWILPHTHYDAEVFMVEKETLEIGYANLVGALRLLRDQPTFKFALDQTCFIEPFLKAYPEEKPFLQEMINAGRLEIVGGTHSMPDENIPSGESFIRNVLYGKQSCAELLHVDVRCGWPIDTFGHHPQMPQMMVKCGFDVMTFQRLMAKDSPSEFYWQGIDGTRIFCHWMPRSYAIFYGAPGNLHEFRAFVEPRLKNLASHAVTPHLAAPAGADLTPVEPHMLAMIEAYNHSQDEFELLIATPSECFTAIQQAGDFQTITADLNPAFQGCYSARIEVKQWNRELETWLTNCEKLDAVAQRFSGEAQTAHIWGAWRGVLFNQGHDNMCGCFIDPVLENMLDRFKISRAAARECLEASLHALASQIDTHGEGVPVVLFNLLGWERSEAVECAVAFSERGIFELAVCDSAGNRVPSDLLQAERYPDGSLKRARLLFVARAVPAFGYEVYRVLSTQEPAPATDLATSHPYGGLLRFELDHGWLENAFYRLEFDLWSGVITSLFDKSAQWEMLPDGLKIGNTVVKEQDYGNFWQYNGPCKGDEFYPVEGRYPLPAFNDNKADFSHSYLGDGNIRSGQAMVEFSISHPFGSGTYATRVRLYAGLPRIDIQTMLVNNDEHIRYRAVFPTSIQGGKITYEIPFGAIERPEGEFPAQNWIDYSDESRGVTLLNRGLPGNNVVDGVMLLSLLKCTALEGGYADFKLGPVTQQGYEKGKQHTFDYALIPHTGSWQDAQSYRRGAEFNHPLIIHKPSRHPGSLPARMSFIKLAGETIVLSAVKACPGGMIVRVYEAEGRRASQGSLELSWPLTQAFEVNLIEQDPKDIPIDRHGSRLSFNLGPFEIKTFKLLF